LLGIGPERLASLKATAFERAESLLGAYLDATSTLSNLQELPLQLLKDLTRFTWLEQLRTSLAEQPGGTQGVTLVARHLQEVHGLVTPIYLVPDANRGRLIARPLPGMTPPPALAVPVEGSDTAAAMAFQWNRPITAITVNQGGASLLDTQLARLAGVEGVLAIPVGEETPAGVLLTCGYRGQLVNLGEDQDYLGKLGRIAGRHRGEALGDHGAELREQQGLLWHLRTRQLAHEINNPLGIIKNYLALLRVKLGGDAAIADELRVIHEELDRIARSVHALVGERPDFLESAAEVDVNALLGDLVKVAAAGPVQQKGVRIEQRFEPGLGPLRCHPDRLRQLLLNLLLNAMEAAPEQGVVSLETHRIVNHRLERQVEILVSNTGPAIAPDVLARLFEPVQSTKGEAHAGLGLSIVRSLASDLRASVSCRSQPGLTTFQVLLPMDDGPT
jgi:signal transduction histidine kinase